MWTWTHTYYYYLLTPITRPHIKIKPFFFFFIRIINTFCFLFNNIYFFKIYNCLIIVLTNSSWGLTFRYLRVVPLRIVAIIIDQVILLHQRHRFILLLAQPPAGCPAGFRRRASAYLEVLVLPYERLVPIIRLVFSILRRPWRSIPNRTVHPHWPYWKSRVVLSCVSSNRYVVHKKSVKIMEEFTIIGNL